MSAVVVTAVFHPAEGKKEQLAQALMTAIPAVHEGEGCLLYSIHDAEDGTITMIEKWTSDDLLDAHANGTAVEVLETAVAPFLASPTVVPKMTPIPAGTHEQGNL